MVAASVVAARTTVAAKTRGRKMTALVLRHAPLGPDQNQDEWMWTLAYGHHRDRALTRGVVPPREAMAAFAKSWRRQG
jgi:hypothetical protein